MRRARHEVLKIPEMIIPYADAASVILANVTPGDWMSRRRVGLALPVGMRGTKKEWAAQPRDADRASDVGRHPAKESA